MPKLPKTKNLTENVPDILNAIRDNSSPQYQSMVPRAAKDASNVWEIGSAIYNYEPIQNEFVNALVNRIGLVLVTSKLYENPWSFFKRGVLEYGETVEEIFVNLANPHKYDVSTAEKEVFKREIPDVRSAFHTLNYQVFYKVTIQNEELRKAFLSPNGIVDLIARIVDSLYTGVNADEFLMMKYLIARNLLAGRIKTVPVTYGNNIDYKKNTAKFKSISNQMEFLSHDYNFSGVYTHTPKNKQFLILTAEYDATNDVEVLASAFNMSKAEFMGRRVLVDSFSNIDNSRLQKLFLANNAEYYTPITASEKLILEKLVGVLVDVDWFMIFDNILKFTENYNGQGLYWNYFLHTWKTFSVSPFANAVGFVSDDTESTITSVTVSPEQAQASIGTGGFLSATVKGTGVYNAKVKWSSSSQYVTIDENSGYYYVANNENVDGTQATLKATSVQDSTKNATATLSLFIPQ